MPGPAPKPESKRRRYGKPKSYGAAEPVVTPAAAPADRVLGIDDAHPLVADLWEAVATSCESRFYSEADWQRLRWELWYANGLIREGARSPTAWAAVQHGLTEMLVSPAVKRRAGIELRPVGVDADVVAANNQIARYKTVLKSV
jgi:hypothetical protein